MLINLRGGVHPVRMLHKKFQHPVLRRGQTHKFPFYQHFLASQIHTNTAVDKLFFRRGGVICRAKAQNVKIVSSMGTGNKLSADFVIKDISETSVCPLARAVRKALRERGIASGVPVLFSREAPREGAGRTPASISYVPAVAGLRLAEFVIRDILAEAGVL